MTEHERESNRGGRCASTVAPTSFNADIALAAATRRIRRHSRSSPMKLALLLATFLALWAPSLRAQDTSLEEFDEVDPYTKGQPELMKLAGIEAFGPIAWSGKVRSPDVKAALGGVDVIFIESANFRLASTLESYKIGEDREDKRWLNAEIAEFKKLFPKHKYGTKIDPWLRAHLWIRRLEQWHADFTKTFGLSYDDFTNLEKRAARGEPMGAGPYLGQKEKFTVLLAQKRSALGRYLRQYAGLDVEYSYRFQHENSYFLGTNFELLEEGERDFEIAFASGVAASLTANFVDAMRDSRNVAPEWFRYGLAHAAARRVDPRWNQWQAGGDPTSEDDDSWKWEPRVLGLAKNKVAPPWSEMMGWAKLEQIKPRDHMIVWSRVEWLLDERKDKARELLLAFTKPIDDWGPKRDELRVQQHAAALKNVLGATPEELDEAWLAWVQRTYGKKR